MFSIFQGGKKADGRKGFGRIIMDPTGGIGRGAIPYEPLFKALLRASPWLILGLIKAVARD